MLMDIQQPQETSPSTETNNERNKSIPTGVFMPISTVTPLAAPSISKKEYELMNGILHRLTNYRDPNGHDVSKDFQRLVNKRILPDYFDIIKEPMAFSTIRGKILRKQYQSFKGFVRDFALISYNAQFYNRPSALVYADSLSLRELFKEELKKLVESGSISPEDAEIPYFGEIPEVEESPPPDPNEEEEEEEEEEDDDDDDDSDEDRTRRGRKKGRRSSVIVKNTKTEDGNKEDPESQKKRGRPPKVHTPMEARINTLLKGLRKFKNPSGDLKILPFEKLPDKSLMPEYYQEIKQPIAMDLIKRKAKRKKYHSVDQVLKDLDLMFDNAKSYNLEDSQVYRDAVDLQREARLIADQEKRKPDSEFVDEDGRLPVPEILYNHEIWKVGDWVHLVNTNDVTKPIIAQIYRTWQDPEGQKWINACWYYRPEQTVHNFEKHFYENEVVKTGQYRDHKIEEVVDRCFVMFFTRYNKGRPRGFPPDKEVYVCEARYNEEKFKLNKIKTWASCVPDEVREKDYEMDLFSTPKKMKKNPSPIKHLLREDAKEDDPLPKPTWGVPNAPPIVGAVHKIPRGPNESPPPEPTPSPPPPETIRRPVTIDRTRFDSQTDVSTTGLRSNIPLNPTSSSQTIVQTPYSQQTASIRPPASPIPVSQPNLYVPQVPVNQLISAPTPLYQSQSSYAQFASTTTPVPQQSKPTSNYSHFQNRNTNASTPVLATSHNSHTNIHNPPRPIEVYTLPESANSSIPSDIRAQFHRDELGRVLFFTTPPVDINPVPEETRILGHSLRYLADKARCKEMDIRKRKDYDSDLKSNIAEKKQRLEQHASTKRDWFAAQGINSIKKWSLALERETANLYRQID
ncbi:hypothetical protein K3495_g1161 [Podosphaera aphanis]|nr:hypothetical protein K3495_g1161 [Podosphaera aphanis]